MSTDDFEKWAQELAQEVAQVDLEYSLAIDQDGTALEGVYVHPLPPGANIMVDDAESSAACYLTAAECRRLAHYLLACAKAVES
jgi:hypothetical protein